MCNIVVSAHVGPYIYTQTPKTKRSNVIGLDRKHMCYGGHKAAAAAAAAGAAAAAATAAAGAAAAHKYALG